MVGTPSREMLEMYVRGLDTLTQALPWARGDLMNYLELRYGEEYAQFVTLFGVAEGSLRNQKLVASVFPPRMRNRTIPWSYYADLTALASRQPKIADKLLQECADEELHRTELRERIREETGELQEPVYEPESVGPIIEQMARLCKRLVLLADDKIREDALVIQDMLRDLTSNL